MYNIYDGSIVDSHLSFSKDFIANYSSTYFHGYPAFLSLTPYNISCSIISFFFFLSLYSLSPPLRDPLLLPGPLLVSYRHSLWKRHIQRFRGSTHIWVKKCHVCLSGSGFFSLKMNVYYFIHLSAKFHFLAGYYFIEQMHHIFTIHSSICRYLYNFILCYYE